jgi:hypothetical protein
MADVTRRAFLGTGSGAAVAGVAFSALPGLAAAAPASAAPSPRDRSPGPGDTPAAGSYVVHVRDARTGDLSVMTGETEVLLNDPALVARVVAASAGR